MSTFELESGAELVIARGDITTVRVDAIVNAANPRMLGGGGVDGAIHRAAGPRLRSACEAVPEVTPGVRCPVGEARITPGFDLPARLVVHTVGPVYESPEASAPLLASAHANAIRLAHEHGARTIAFPAISCGVYGYPIDEAAPIAVRAALEGSGLLDAFRFVLFDDRTASVWRAAASARLDGR